MTKHPSNKFQRKLIAEKKHRFVDEKKAKIQAQRPAKVWRKRVIESLKEQEHADDLKNYGNASLGRSDAIRDRDAPTPLQEDRRQ